MSTDLDTPSSRWPGDDPADDGFTQIEFPPSYSDFANARRRFLDLISLDAASNRTAPGPPVKGSGVSRFTAGR